MMEYMRVRSFVLKGPVPNKGYACLRKSLINIVGLFVAHV